MRLLKFEAPWCTRCHTMTKIMEDINFPFPVEHINIDVERDAAMEYGIRGIPHMILLDENNNIVTRIGGVTTKQQLLEALEIE